MPDALQEGGFGAGGCALGEAGVEGHLGAGVGEEQVLDDLLDAPLAGMRGRVKLGLGGVESAERGGDLALELVEGGVHRGRITLHRRWAGRLWMGGADFLRSALVQSRYCKSARAFLAALAFSPSGSSLR